MKSKLSNHKNKQRVRRHGAAVGAVTDRDHKKLIGARLSFKEFLLGDGPSLKGLDLARDRSPVREIKL